MCFHHLVLIAVLGGCAPAPAASQPHPVNVALTRHEIEQSLPTDRKIVSMGHVTEASAVVYTDPRTGPSQRREETWVHGSDGWKLRDAKPVEAAN